MPNKSILIVDDNPANMALVAFVLSTKGYDVQTAANADEALAAIDRRLPRLILMDIQLPGTDGLTLTRNLKADPRTRDTIIVAVTSYAMKGDEERVRNAGCDGYITKPIDTRSLAGTIAGYLSAGPSG